MGVSVKVTVDDDYVKRAFQRLIAVGRNPTRALQNIGRYGKSSTQLRFRAQRGPDNVAWTPSQRALAAKGQTLKMTGRLRNSLAWNLTTDGVEWGTNVVYAAAHQFGVNDTQAVGAHFRSFPARRTKGKRIYKTSASGANIKYRVHSFRRHMQLPARPFLGVNLDDRFQILRILREEYMRAVGLIP